ncbi:uncharacterized protein BDCG_16052 [Blastomyces dermatitidis ER-3]|uniref:Uncharacterized protein n=2 Tax=Blastomyces TaxID=229219 RepID=A0A179V2Y6_BLAGS|nr:uncharacterized protein BDBG_09472 [Blastomyces gilchristii SLH14081]XP_045279008.1 uncharacterized protein BDCG_16052 [Blastomyces dermatitidis ER-3]OAS99280.1 hypothetical protein BDCG_16052 [Blastomyces dermatitidis ER-3]OAT14440.1 hypothetical protein BDBG_09472 [Blastomyces gilchristii SLH14081]
MVWDKEKWTLEDQPQFEGQGVRCASRLEACIPRPTILKHKWIFPAHHPSEVWKGMKNAAQGVSKSAQMRTHRLAFEAYWKCP